LGEFFCRLGNFLKLFGFSLGKIFTVNCLLHFLGAFQILGRPFTSLGDLLQAWAALTSLGNFNKFGHL